MQSLDLWLQTLPEHDRRELTDTTQPDQQTHSWFEQLEEPEQVKWLEYLRQRYVQHRGDIIDPKLVEELKNDDRPY